MCETLLLLRTRYHFNGYIHVKTIPGASDELLAAAGYLADRISVNLELPTETALRSLAPNKTMQNTNVKLKDNTSVAKENPDLISHDKNSFTKHILTWENA